MRKSRALTTVLAAALIASACTSDGESEQTAPGTDLETDGIILTSSGLEIPGDCDVLLTRLVEEGLEHVGPYGLNGGQYWFGDETDVAMEDDEMAADDAMSDSSGGAPATPTTTMQAEGASGEGGDNFSGTNNQETDVEEPDLVKTDGSRLVVLTGQRLTVFDTTGRGLDMVMDIKLADDTYAHEMFLVGDRVFLMANGWSDIGFGRNADLPYGINTTRLVEVDISSGEIGATLEFEGQHLSAREVNGTIRFVISTGIGHFPFVYPSNQAAEEGAEIANRAIIEDSTIDQWLPSYRLVNPDGSNTEAQLFDCNRMHLPADFAGFGSVTVLTVDANEGLDLVDSLGVLTDGQTIYASTDRLTVATNRYPEFDRDGNLVDDAGYSTSLHNFDISDPASTGYVGSGEVPGYLLSQYSLSEHNGYLRAATTAGDPWSGEQSESLVTVLAEEDGELVTVGQVDGLGKGERIFAVRFMGDVGYVVTFRQIDPLYVLDLSDPTDPMVTGELKIPGFSTYLHPTGEGQLVGVGQDATDDGRTTGAQVSTFDVSDMTEPIRVDQLDLGENTHSAVDWDPRAFTWWGPERIAFVPISWWGWDDETGEDQSGSASVVVAVSEDGSLVELGRIEHPVNRECESDYMEEDWEEPIADEVEEEGREAPEEEEPVNTTVPSPPDANDDAEADLVEETTTTIVEETETVVEDAPDAVEDITPAPPEFEDYCWSYAPEIRRSVIIGDVVYTVSDAGVQANNLSDFGLIEFVDLSNR